MASKKQFGLIKPKKKAETEFFRKKNIFDDDDDDDDKAEAKASSSSTDWFKASMEAKKVKRQTRLEMEKAEEEDESVFKYDEVYDDMQEKKRQETAKLKAESSSKEAKKPKYIANLLKQAEIRNREHERRVERKVQKEREAEGEHACGAEAVRDGARDRLCDAPDQKLDSDGERKDLSRPAKVRRDRCEEHTKRGGETKAEKGDHTAGENRGL